MDVTVHLIYMTTPYPNEPEERPKLGNIKISLKYLAESRI